MTATTTELTTIVFDQDFAAKATKRSFTTRRVPLADMRTIISGSVCPQPGDLVLAKVLKIGSHKHLESPAGRRAVMFQGDEIIVCYGNRYAPDQFEAIVGADLGPCDLVAAGGIASQSLSRHQKMSAPTRIEPIGLIGDAEGKRINVRDYAVSHNGPARPISCILVTGTAMNSGKTLTVASIIHSLRAAGHRVAGIKATGTGAGGDPGLFRDAGADLVLDFTDAGFASTYKIPANEIERATISLIGHAASEGCDYAVIEIADGLQQQETVAFMRSAAMRLRSVGVVFASYDAMGAKAGVDMLTEMGHRVIALSGMMTQSPLATREAEMATGLSVFSPKQLQGGAIVSMLKRAALMTAEVVREKQDILFMVPQRAAGHAFVPAMTQSVESGLPA